jgi:hypothetical protein
MRISVTAWSPDYSAELDLAEADDSAVEVDPTCEVSEWRVLGPVGAPEDVVEVVFVDGVRRTDARLFVTADEGAEAKPGLAGSIGVGAVSCAPAGAPARPAVVLAASVRRYLAVGGGGADGAALIAGAALDYRALAATGNGLKEVDAAIHSEMRRAEADLAVALSRDDNVVFIDGPLARMNPGPRRVAGLIKSHTVSYLDDDHDALLGELDRGQRTPLFSFGGPQRPRYSWYLRLCGLERAQHPWHGLVRLEVPAELGLAGAAALADLSSALLPAYASEPHWDKRAPQNLVPVAGLERRLRHLLGERELVYRMLRSAAACLNREGAA